MNLVTKQKHIRILQSLPNHLRLVQDLRTYIPLLHNQLLCVKKEKVPGTRLFVFIFRCSRTRARASNRLRVRSVKILWSFSRGEEKNR